MDYFSFGVLDGENNNGCLFNINFWDLEIFFFMMSLWVRFFALCICEFVVFILIWGLGLFVEFFCGRVEDKVSCIGMFWYWCWFLVVYVFFVFF